MKAGLCAATLIFSLPCIASAGSRITYRGIDGGSSPTVLIGANRVRIDADVETRLIIDPGKQTMMVLDLGARKYTKVDHAEIDRLDGMFAQIDDMLSNIPEGLRGGVGDLLGRGGAGAGIALATVSNTGLRDSAAGLPCTMWRSVSGGELVAEGCLGDAGAWNLDRADRSTVEASMRLLQDWSRRLQRGGLSRYYKASSFPIDQVPLRVTQFDAGRPSTSEFSSSDRIDVSASDFQIPAGFRERAIEVPAMGR